MRFPVPCESSISPLRRSFCLQHTVVLTIKSMNNEKTRSEWVWMTRKKHNHTLGTSRQFSL